MSIAERYHRTLRWAALAIAAINLLSVFGLDTREWLVYFDPIAGRALVLPAFLLALPALPFLLPIDRDSSSIRATTRWLELITFVIVAFEALWWFQIAIAMFFRGPDWNFYWPWEDRVAKFVPLNNVDLSEYFWVLALGCARPADFLTREASGLALVGTHLLLVPLLVASVVRIRSKSIATWRLLLLALSIQLLTLIALKLAIRCLWNVKYVIYWPEHFLNL